MTSRIFTIITYALLILACGNTAVSAKLYSTEADPHLRGVFLLEQEDGPPINPRFRNVSPAIGEDGTIYIMGNNHCLYAINPDGTVKWNVENIIRHSSYTNHMPAIGPDGTIYIMQKQNLSAISADGKIKWEFYFDNTIDENLAVASDGTIYIACDVGNLYALYPDGTVKWNYHFGEHVTCTPVIGPDGTIYVECFDNYIYALHPWGTLKWKYKVYESITGPAVGNDGTLYFESNNRLHAVDSNGILQWKSDDLTYGYPAIGADGTIYIGGYYETNFVMAYYPDGSLKWKSDRVGNAEYISLGADGTIYANQWREACAFDSTGVFLWSHKFEDDCECPVLSPDGTMYIAALYLYAFDTESYGYPAGAPWPMYRPNNSRCIYESPDEPPPLHTLYGYVVMPDSTPVANVRVTIDSLVTVTDEKGYFSFELPDGEYGIYVHSLQHGLPQTVRATIQGTDTPVYLYPSQRHEVSGRLMVHDVPLPHWNIHVADTYTTTGPDGRFTLRLFDGNYVLEFDREDSYFPSLKDITVAGSDQDIGDMKLYPMKIIYQSSPGIRDGIFWIHDKPHLMTSTEVFSLKDGILTEVYHFDDEALSPIDHKNVGILFPTYHSLVALDYDFSFKWEYPLQQIVFPQISADGTIYIGITDGITALNPDGTLKWSHEFGTNAVSRSHIALGEDGTIYVSCNDNTLYALAPDGSVRWTDTGNDNIYSQLYMCPDGSILFLRKDNYIYSIRPDGSLKWKFDVENCSDLFILDDGESIYLNSGDYKLWALTQDGELIWSIIQPPDLSRLVYNSHTNEIWGYNDEAICIFDPADGSLLRRHAMGFLGFECAPDGDTYAFYLNSTKTAYCVYNIDTTPGDPVAVDDHHGNSGAYDVTPSTIVLSPPFPNPFNPATTISFTLPDAGHVRVAIFDISGQNVRELITGHLPAGLHEMVWDSRDENGNTVSSGVYFCRLVADEHLAVRKMMLIR